LTELLYFDNDCISAFLWVDEQSILAQMYPGRIVIPKPVYDELSYPGVQHLKKRIDKMVSLGQASIMTISTDSKAYSIYREMTQEPKKSHCIIGNGEAACLALAIENSGVVASNNLRDIKIYLEDYNVKHITTADIMVEAFQLGYVTESEANTIWESMLRKRRRLGADSFSEYLQSKSY